MHGRVSGPSSLLDQEVIAPCGCSVPCQFDQWSGDMAVGSCGLGAILHDRVSRGQSWSQTATDGAWSSTTALLSGRDRPRCLCVFFHRKNLFMKEKLNKKKHKLYTLFTIYTSDIVG